VEFRFSPEALAFEEEVRRFLDAEWGPELRLASLRRADGAEESRSFRRKLAARGWLTLSWPVEYGGQGRSYEEQYLFHEALNYVGAPKPTVATQQVGPTLMQYGSDRQKQAFLPRIAAGEMEFALGYTEPDAGTDLASLQLRAVRDGDDYVLNGIKRFTSTAHSSEYVWLAARTDPQAPKHRGISMFIVDMQTPGITVKPIWTLSGVRTNEVYWADVRVPAEALVGEENRGWYYAAHALDFERVSLFTIAGVRAAFDRLLEWARTPVAGGQAPGRDARVRTTLAGFKVEIEVLQALSYRNLGLLKAGEHPNDEASMVKIMSTELMQRLQNAGTKLLGLYGQLPPEEPRAPLHGAVEQGYRAAVMPTFGAGSNEVMRNIIATRGLGLPRG
jgi:alkylation response protein AidB-like acyl-CoA dehydrogenase